MVKEFSFQDYIEVISNEYYLDEDSCKVIPTFKLDEQLEDYLIYREKLKEGLVCDNCLNFFKNKKQLKCTICDKSKKLTMESIELRKKIYFKNL